MNDTTIRPGHRVTFSKTVGESDVYLFAGITGDLAPNHTDEEFMKSTRYGRRIAHGVLLLGFASTATTMFLKEVAASGVSYGYNRVRFTAPVYIGDTITVAYVCREVDAAARRSFADVTVTNQDGVTCLVAEHVLALM